MSMLHAAVRRDPSLGFRHEDSPQPRAKPSMICDTVACFGAFQAQRDCLCTSQQPLQKGHRCRQGVSHGLVHIPRHQNLVKTWCRCEDLAKAKLYEEQLLGALGQADGLLRAKKHPSGVLTLVTPLVSCAGQSGRSSSKQEEEQGKAQHQETPSIPGFESSSPSTVRRPC